MVPQVNVQLTEKSGSLSDVINKFKKTISDFLLRIEKDITDQNIICIMKAIHIIIENIFHG